jgi:hypothetical protein
MLKTWLRLTPAAIFVFLLLTTPAQTSGEIIFLHLRRDTSGITLLGADSRPGHLKPQSQNGPLEFEVSSPDGRVLHQARISDPLLERIEYPTGTGSLRAELRPRESSEFTIRLPETSAGHKLKFFQRPSAQPGRLTAESRKLVGEITIPENPGRLQAFSTSARLHTLLANGPTSGRLNIAILAEGFTLGEETTFTNRALAVLNQFLAASPYKEYRNHFNGLAIFVPSAQSGSDHPTASTYRNTYFNSTYGTGSLVRLITIPSDGIGKVNSLLEQFVPEYDIALLLVNDSEYGGSGGFPAIASIHTSSSELALHEIGHSFAGLGDEYDAPAPGYPDVEHPNTTKETRRDSIKWRDWINPSTPIPTPETSTHANVVGLFEGAYFHETDWFRPKLDCRMKTLGQPFCEVCKEAIVLAAYSRLEIIQSSSPSENSFTVPGGGEITLSVDGIDPVQMPLSYTWTIDGVTNNSYSSDSFPASFETLGTGRRLVRVSVSDPTPLVRTDTFGKLWKSRDWLVQILSATNQPPVLPQISNVQLPPLDSNPSISFTVSDPDTPPESLNISARSSNTNLVADSDLRLSGRGTNRSISIGTYCGRFGTTTITIFASDGDNVVSNSFTATIEYDFPAFIHPIADQRAFSGPTSVPVEIRYEGCHELSVLASASNTNLLPNVLVEGRGTNRLLRLVPIVGATGTSTVIVTVSTHDTARSQESFTVTFLTAPIAIAATPRQTPEGILLRFTSEPAAAMVLERSPDFQFWAPVLSTRTAASLEYVVPDSTLGAVGFYRLRLLPL